MKCLTVEFKNGAKTEVHMLNPKEVFSNFGGSRSGLVVGKTASLIIREVSAMGHVDSERDIHDKNFWKWVAKLIDDKTGEVVSVTANAS